MDDLAATATGPPLPEHSPMHQGPGVTSGDDEIFLERAAVEGFPWVGPADLAAIALALDDIEYARREIAAALPASTEPAARHVRRLLNDVADRQAELRRALSYALQQPHLGVGLRPAYPSAVVQGLRLFQADLHKLTEEEVARLAPLGRVSFKAARDWLIRRGSLDP